MTDTQGSNKLQLKHPDRIYVGGAWIEPSTQKMIEIICPNTEKVVACVAEAVEADMDRAAAAARKAFDDGAWPRTDPKVRAETLRAFARALKKREAAFAQAWTLQVGGLTRMAPFMVAGGSAVFESAAALTERFEFQKVSASLAAPAAVISLEPVGVVAAIAPWNAPYVSMAGKVASALAAGCTIVMKPAPETPIEAYLIAEAAEEVGLPPGVLNLVCGGRVASEHLVSNPDVDKVAFTGSSATGKRIASICGARIARCTLELGGKSAAIIRDDFAIADAARLLAGTITSFSGQVCVMLSRAIVSRKRHDELADAIAAAMRGIKVGHSDAPDTMMGPLAMARQRDKVESCIAAGRQEGADLVFGGGRPAAFDRGYFVEPTLFANVRNETSIAQEEIFGPVLSLIPCDDEEDSIRIANQSNYGLFGSVLTHDTEAAYRIARSVRSGAFAQNGMRLDFSLPFGGFKQSGIGREGGKEGLESYLETKTILLDALPSRLN